MKKPLQVRDETDLNIRLCWSINAAVAFAPKDGWKGTTLKDDFFLLKNNAERFLDLFQEMKDEQNVCESCGGLSGKPGNPVINGMHEKCRTSEKFKKNNL